MISFRTYSRFLLNIEFLTKIIAAWIVRRFLFSRSINTTLQIAVLLLAFNFPVGLDIY